MPKGQVSVKLPSPLWQMATGQQVRLLYALDREPHRGLPVIQADAIHVEWLIILVAKMGTLQ